VEVAPRFDATLPPAAERALAGVGVIVTHDADALRLAFSPSAAPY
jgi:hypothetical protein